MELNATARAPLSAIALRTHIEQVPAIERRFKDVRRVVTCTSLRVRVGDVAVDVVDHGVQVVYCVPSEHRPSGW